MFEVFRMFQRYVTSVLYRVATIDRDVAHVATYVSSVCYDCFICFMLQIFHLHVAKVDLDVAYICMVARLCF
jgi:hypothetical protein